MREEAQCTAKSSRTGERCRKARMLGTSVCGSHGGRAPAVRAAASRRLAIGQVKDLLAEVGNTNPDPLAGLREELASSGAMCRVLRLLVGELDMNQLHHRGRQHALMTMQGEWSDRHARQCELALKLGFAERELGLAEDQGALVARVVTAMLDAPEMALEGWQRERARHLIAASLRALNGGKGPDSY